MKFRMREKSLFAILLRSPWWISIAIAVVIGLGARMAMPPEYGNYVMFSGGPFLVVGCIAAWKQFKGISNKESARILGLVAGMTWTEFSAAVEKFFTSDGFVVVRLADAKGASGADFEITKAGRKAVVSCKRWKAASIGLENLRDLLAVGQSRGANDCLYLGTGVVSESAGRFARESKIDVVQGPRLAQLIRLSLKK